MSDFHEKTPCHAPSRKHQPILSVDYKQLDVQAGYGDAHFMDIGRSTWDKKDFSIKLWRWVENDDRGFWSRQSEELPLSRALDLAILVSAAATGKASALQEFYQWEEMREPLQDFLKKNMPVLGPRLEELRRLLQPSMRQAEDTRAPNIFSFATSELSQDAMFAWLLSWADPKYAKVDRSLHEAATLFARLSTGIDDLEVKKLETGRQWKHIDIWAEIDDNIFLAIEDKTMTTIHDEQLQHYKDIVKREYPDSNYKKCFAYVKIGNEPEEILKQVRKNGYRIVLRKDILDCLDKYSGDNMLLCNYREHLRSYEQATQSFRTQLIKNWKWNAWEGFYKELEGRKIIDSWGYVANPKGGFLGAWWHFVDFSNGQQMYLQFEQTKLCFKICGCESNQRSSVRNKCCETLLEMADGRFPEIHRPHRFGTGEYMTIAVVDLDEIWGKDTIDLNVVIDKLKKYEDLVDECVRVCDEHALAID